MIPPLICVFSFTALWVLARMKIFAQRNGVFFSLAVIAMLGAFAALIEQAWLHLAKRTESEPRVATSMPAQTQPPVAAPQIPSLIEALQLEQPDSSLPRARATRDLTTTIGGKTYAIRRGDVFLFSDEKNGEVTLSAGEFLARVPTDSMQILSPTAEAAPAPKSGTIKSVLEDKATAEITQRAQKEAARLYPALGRNGSAENRDFVDTVKELQRRNSDFFDNPEWPLELAQTLARRNGWKQSGVIDDDTPPVVESKIAPGTQVLAEPITPSPSPADDPDIPPPPRVPNR